MLKRTADGFADLGVLLEPRSVAVIGASDRAGNIGGHTVTRLRRFGFPGPVWPVNRNGGTVGGLPAIASIAELPETPDLAIMALPAEGLLAAVDDCIAKGIRAGVVYTGGLGEAGGEGALLERRIAERCRESGFALCGPNCVGYINTGLPITATFATALEEITKLVPGAISMVTQSGGIGTTTFYESQRAGFPFRYLVSSGNEAVVDLADYLHAFAIDPGTKVIIGYLEGVKDGAKFIRALETARATGKPVVLLKSGATAAGAAAALAHTGALVGADRVFDAVFAELGVARARSIEELIQIAATLAGQARTRLFGRGVGIVTFGGGNGVLGADQCIQAGLVVPNLRAATRERLKPLLATVATAANPIDLTPTTAMREAYLSRLPDALQVLADQDDIDTVLVIVGTLASRANAIVDQLLAFAGRATKPLLVSWPSPPSGLVERLAEAGIYTFVEPADAVRALARLAAAGQGAAAPAGPVGPAPRVDWAALIPDVTAGLVVPEHRCHALLRAAGLPVAAGDIATNLAGAKVIAARTGYPLALKALSARVTHRAASGLLLLGIEDEAALAAGFAELERRAAAQGAALDGIYVQTMHGGSTELLVAAIADPLFGPMVSVASGGVLTELLDDVVTARAPVGEAQAAAMIERLKVRRYARDDRGPLATAAPAAFVAALSALFAAAPYRRFTFEANPVKWTREGVVALDGLLVIEEP
jgi:acetyltransferase